MPCGGEHHVGDYNAAGHTKNGIIGDLKKRAIHRRAGTIGDYSDKSSYRQWCPVAGNIMTMTITLLFTQGRELSVTKKGTIHRKAGTVGDQSSYSVSVNIMLVL